MANCLQYYLYFNQIPMTSSNPKLTHVQTPQMATQYFYFDWVFHRRLWICDPSLPVSVQNSFECVSLQCHDTKPFPLVPIVKRN